VAVTELSPRPPARSDGRVPPHNLDAEMSLLGAMLLSRDAIVAATEAGVGAADFYKPAHGHVFDAITTLYATGEPADPVTVAEALKRADLLEAVGGPAILLTLQAQTPATSNAGRYARIITEHALLRRLIGVAGEIAEMGYSVPDDVIAAVDRAEAMVFDVAQRRVTDTLSPIKELLDASLTRLEQLYERGDAITGLPTGYNGLDELLSGLQPSTLNIVGARPATGKALALDTPIPTPTGWTTMGELQPGDQVVDEQGQPCDVLYTSPIFRDHVCYELRFDDGSTIVADAGHRWYLDDRATGDGGVRTTQDLVDVGVHRRDRTPRWWIPVAQLDLPEADLPVDPYVLGASIGDGHDVAPGDAAHFAGEREMVGGPAGRPRSTVIPAAYLRASAKQRLALLQGLMDADGTICPAGDVELQLSDRHLVAQAWELVVSLGHKPNPVCRTSDGWRFRWTPHDPVFRLDRKASVLAASTTNRHGCHSRRAIVEIVPVPTVPTRCIAVSSPSHLFLAGRAMIPTHNTAFALGLASHAALEARRPVLIFSLEMSHLELTQRILSSEARVDSTRMRNGKLAEADWTKISHAIGRLAEAPLYIDDNPQATVMEIRAKARRLKSKLGDLGLIVIDYLQLMTGGNRAENRQVEVSEISRGLKILARELQTPVVALSQLSRQLEMRADKRPMLADLRESGSLEQDADTVMFLYRDEIYNPDSPDRGTCEVIVAKHRAGPTGIDRLAFLDHYTRFANLARSM
jgi:replicative DNA helicase